jgi:hypothetical protein
MRYTKGALVWADLCDDGGVILEDVGGGYILRHNDGVEHFHTELELERL